VTDVLLVLFAAVEHANASNALALWPDTHFTIDPGSLVIVGFSTGLMTRRGCWRQLPRRWPAAVLAPAWLPGGRGLAA